MKITAPAFDGNEIALVQECLDSGWVTQGPFVSRFESAFSKRHNSQYCLATTSCTAALHLAMLSLGLRSGDEVIVPAFTWVTSASTVELVGAEVKFVDISLETFNINAKKIEDAITSRTRAIVAVHLFGKAAPMNEIMTLAKKYNLAVIEDAACAVGTSYGNELVGNFGDFGCFSFHPRKVITTGEGGMVTTKNKLFFEKVKSLRNHGSTGTPKGVDPAKPYNMSSFNNLGLNLRMSDIQAAVGLAQMSKLDSLLQERRERALEYSERLVDVDELMLPVDDLGHTYQSYVVYLKSKDKRKRNGLMDHLTSMGIEKRPGNHAVHRLGYYEKKYNLKAQQFPNAKVAEASSVTLPIFPGMTDQDQSQVIGEIKKYFQGHK